MRPVLRYGLWALCLLALPTCLLDGEVDYDGDYALLPRTDNVDTVIYPMRHLLVLEQDTESESTLVYYFTGELSAADLGFADLRRIATGFSRYDMDFATPPEVFARTLATTVEEALSAQAEEDGPGEPLQLRTGDELLSVLVPLSSAQLAPTGASRYLRTLESADFDVRAYAGVLAGPLTEGALRIEGTPVAFTPVLAPAVPEFLPDVEARTATLEQLDLSAADYYKVELLQTIAPLPEPDAESADGGRAAIDAGGPAIDAGTADPDAGLSDAGLSDAGLSDAGMPADEDLRDAIMRTELLPQWLYTVSESLLSGAVEIGCWSPQRPLRIRLVQLARRYQASEDGDVGVLQQRFDVQSVPAEDWQPLLRDELEYRDYCQTYLQRP